MDELTRIQRRLLRLREKRGWSQYTTARALGVTQTLVHRAEHAAGVGPMGLRVLKAELDRLDEADTLRRVVRRG